MITDQTDVPLLGVNIDHIATLRQARRIDYPDPTEIALLAEQAGADYITLHLREDRRHIQDYDVLRMRDALSTHMNLEMAITQEMLLIAKQVQPQDVCIVPEKREELTTEGGLNVADQIELMRATCGELQEAGIRVSLFIDADHRQIDAAKLVGAPVIEIHTGHYASAIKNASKENNTITLRKIFDAVEYAHSLGLIVNAGHGLNYHNVLPLAAHPMISDFNIGHSILARAFYVGIEQAVSEMKQLLIAAR